MRGLPKFKSAPRDFASGLIWPNLHILHRKFEVFSFIGCRDILENFLHGLKREEPSKSVFRLLCGGCWPLEQNYTLGM